MPIARPKVRMSLHRKAILRAGSPLRAVVEAHPEWREERKREAEAKLAALRFWAARKGV